MEKLHLVKTFQRVCFVRDHFCIRQELERDVRGSKKKEEMIQQDGKKQSVGRNQSVIGARPGPPSTSDLCVPLCQWQDYHQHVTEVTVVMKN